MKRMLLGLVVTAVVSFGLLAQTNKANAFLLDDRSPNVTVGQLIAGGSMTGAYFALNHRNRFSVKWWGLTTIGCIALSPIIGGGLVSLNEHRELRSSEVFMMTGDCVVPILGGLFWKAVFDAHPEWDAGTGLSHRW